MAAEEKDTKKEEAPQPPKKKKGLLIGIIAVVLIGLGVGGFLFMKKSSAPHGEAAAEAEEPAAEGGHGDAKTPAAGSIFSLEPFIVNLQDNSGTRYLKLTVNLELPPNSSTSELINQAPQIRDSLIILLSSKSYSDIGTVEGKYQMRDEIISRVNQFLTKTKVKTAFFTEFVIQ
ncbi:MAG: flagellar basal body-associated FliL family protein [Deltaproteobacteria bacterium]|nr:flagellar basal body-associated FliL family protein [Deltaproteobacteria bacterium]